MARTIGSSGKKTEANIRASALELIARHGFEALTMRQLAEAVGIQVGGLYHYFLDKQALLFALIDAHLHELQAMADATIGGADPAARLQSFVTFHILHHVARRNASHVANNELRSLSRENFAVVLKQRGLYEKKLRQILKDGQEAGRFNIIDVPLTTMALIAMLNEVCVWFRDGGAQSLDDIAEHFAGSTIRMVQLK